MEKSFVGYGQRQRDIVGGRGIGGGGRFIRRQRGRQAFVVVLFRLLPRPLLRMPASRSRRDFFVATMLFNRILTGCQRGISCLATAVRLLRPPIGYSAQSFIRCAKRMAGRSTAPVSVIGFFFPKKGGWVKMIYWPLWFSISAPSALSCGKMSISAQDSFCTMRIKPSLASSSRAMKLATR